MNDFGIRFKVSKLLGFKVVGFGDLGLICLLGFWV